MEDPSHACRPVGGSITLWIRSLHRAHTILRTAATVVRSLIFNAPKASSPQDKNNRILGPVVADLDDGSSNAIPPSLTTQKANRSPWKQSCDKNTTCRQRQTIHKTTPLTAAADPSLHHRVRKCSSSTRILWKKNRRVRNHL